MSQEDLKINREARKVLVKHWLDLGRLSIRTSLGKLIIRGFLERIRGVKEDLTPALVTEIFNRIKRINGVVRMTIDLDNWKNDEGLWVKVEKTNRGMISSSSTQAGGGTYSPNQPKKKDEEDKDQPS
ncbi:MAG: hypothetical protein KAH23_08665 [Kiritimatiellae bacterium]|nr:hypothetical protein [Kiritimatiellia bacterium]